MATQYHIPRHPRQQRAHKHAHFAQVLPFWRCVCKQSDEQTHGKADAAEQRCCRSAKHSIRFNDRQSGRVIALDDVDGTLAIPDVSGPFTLSARGLSGGQEVALDVLAAAVAGVLS